MKVESNFNHYTIKNNSNRFSENNDDRTLNHQDTQILCKHCHRTKTNGLRCIGKCIEDSDY